MPQEQTSAINVASMLMAAITVAVGMDTNFGTHIIVMTLTNVTEILTTVTTNAPTQMDLTSVPVKKATY